MELSKQINIYSVDTGALYTRKEENLHWLNCKFRKEKDELRVLISRYETRMMELGMSRKEVSASLKKKFRISSLSEEIRGNSELMDLLDKRNKYDALYKYKNNKINQTKQMMLESFSTKVEKNKNKATRAVRKINPKELKPSNVISIFDSSLTRMLGLEGDDIHRDLIILRVFYFDILKDVMDNGFICDGEKYIYFTNSAGQIRTKKAVFIKESLWKEYERTLMCGLTIPEINRRGGINVNKFLAYLALSNSATEEWTSFDIDKAIVVKDFETCVNAEVDFIDDVTYEVKRTRMDVPIPHSDGCGLVLPRMSLKNFMVRLPWIKGLLAVFDFHQFIKEKSCSPIITDIYGIEHNVIEEDIEVIFTESQFKMYKFYDNWQQYKDYYKEFNCTAGYCNLEPDRFKYGTINYQMLQTLVDMNDVELRRICKRSVTRLNNITTSVRNMLDVFEVTKFNENKNYLQQALELYPELLTDPFFKQRIKQIQKSMIKNYRSGKLEVKGKYTFLIPDLYAFCEYLFLGIEKPQGLLKNGEITCRLFPFGKELDCLRSPHLYFEHAVRVNTTSDEIDKWFITNGIYTSSHDMIEI